jgi:hypothetical protein
MTDPFSTPSARRSPSRRDVLWNELEELHAQLQLPPPTETYTIEDLEAVVAQLRAQLEERAS